MTLANINYAWGNLIVEECIRLGVDYFCIAPGSRSTSLTVAIARHKKAKTFVHFDERALAFHAMGVVSATRKPVALICTSGTAVANFFPAIIEASKKKLPLIVITADRPPELRFTGSVQTIDQVGIFGKYVVWQMDMPCPDLAIKPEVVLTTIDQAVYQAVKRGGVVHLNCMFREPLVPTSTSSNNKQLSSPSAFVGDPVVEKYLKSVSSWIKSTKPYTEYINSVDNIHIDQAKNIAARINNIKNGLIVVGKIGNENERKAVIHLARRLGWPIFADIASGLRLGEISEEVIHYYDQLLLTKMGKALKVDGIIHLGGRITSKRYYEFAQTQLLNEYIMVLNHALRNDPTHQVTLRIESTVTNFCDSVGPLVKTRIKGKHYKDLVKANSAIDKHITKFLVQDSRLSEPLTARLVSQLIPSGTGLFLGNSMPIRDMDMYADFKGPVVLVNGNRGASGIDGLIASAAGYAQGLAKPVTLMIGDVSALHDLNSLAMLRDINYPLVIVILNNGGGAIFSFLPIAQHQDVFEKFFGTPHATTFANAAAMFELNYAQPQDAVSFAKIYKQAIQSPTATIIEVINSREENLKLHQQLQSSL